MQVRTFILLGLILVVASCTTEKKINLTNTSEVDVQKSIELKRGEVETILGTLPEKETAIFEDQSENKFPVQLDDIDGDGKWDVLFTQIEFKAGESKSLELEFEDEKIPVKTNIRLADKGTPPQEFAEAVRLATSDSPTSQATWQMEGVGWENDVVGFRNYFDARNGIDIYGKRTSEMVLDECGLDGGPTYHELQPWGMDILKVANSLGAGAIALKTSTGLYRIGPDCKGTFKIVKEGSLRSIFDFDFEGMQVDGNVVNVKHRIIIEAGNPYYNSEVWVEGIDGAQLVTGIVNLHSEEFWSKTLNGYSYFFTHDNQAYDGEKLGMAVLVPTNNMVVETAPEEGEGITQTFYTAMDITEQPVKFYFMVGWELQSEANATAESFETEIEKQIKKLSVKIDLK